MDGLTFPDALLTPFQLLPLSGTLPSEYAALPS